MLQCPKQSNLLSPVKNVLKVALSKTFVNDIVLYFASVLLLSLTLACVVTCLEIKQTIFQKSFITQNETASKMRNKRQEEIKRCWRIVFNSLGFFLKKYSFICFKIFFYKCFIITRNILLSYTTEVLQLASGWLLGFMSTGTNFCLIESPSTWWHPIHYSVLNRSWEIKGID